MTYFLLPMMTTTVKAIEAACCCVNKAFQLEVRLLSHQGDEYENVVYPRSPGDEETTVYAS